MRIIIAIAIVLLAGCNQRYENLQPFVAAAGSYSMLEVPTVPPAPPSGCADGCKCGGTGIEKSGDGLEDIPCRCEDDCPCKAKTSKGTAGWPPRSTVR